MAALFSVAACEPAAETAGVVPPEAPATPGCGDSGHFEARIYGAITARLDWSGAGLSCEGMPRPEGKGARLRFAGSADDHPLVIIVAMPELTRESAGTELASNVTLIEEGSGQFYSTADLDVCLTQVDAMAALDVAGDRYMISGRVFCVAPLAEVNGDASITVAELEFTGLLDWNAS